MSKIIIPLNGQTESEIEKMDGVITSISWDALMPTINQHVRLRPDEIIDGLVINETDIRVKISRKKGRKIKA